MGVGSMFQRAAQWAGDLFKPGGIAAYQPLIEQINAMERTIEKLDDAQLVAKTAYFKEKLANGAKLDDLLVEAFAVVREASRRELGMRHYDVQLIGGIGLHKGNVVEMKTGEGKTLVATLPSYLNALEGKGVHVVTVNDYLASRDAEWMGRIHRFLGLEVGVVLENMNKSESIDRQMRKKAYGADITYVTNHELVFDYLRDNLATELNEVVHRGQHFAIVDEVDLLLIDEVRTPLIISGPGEEKVSLYKEVDQVVRRLNANTHYKLELKSKTAALTEEGLAKVEKELSVGSLSDPSNLQWYHAVYQSVLAHGAYKNDVDYIVKTGQVQLIDEHTGRVSPDKRFSDGLHQALEAKEKLKVQPEDRTFARMSYQSYFRLYRKLCGMTGTAKSEKAEFQNTYGMKVLGIPTNVPVQRVDFEDAVFRTEEEKLEAIASEVQEVHREGRPVLIGTVSVRESEQLARKLKKKKIPCQVLNAKHHEKEAAIVSQAGRKGAVTISTNMAGRGTDILLGGNPEKMAAQKAKEGSEKYEQVLKRFKEECEENRKEVLKAGGLHVIGSSLHDAPRLDNQLRGRAGRQGDPGSTQFIICLEDEIFLKFGEHEIDEVMGRYEEVEKYEEITDKGLLRLLESLRKKVQMEYANERTETLKYDMIVTDQRNHIYNRRAALLADSVDLEAHRETAGQLIEGVVVELAEMYLDDPEYAPTEADLEELEEAYRHLLSDSSIALPEVELPGDVTVKIINSVLEQVLALRSKRERAVEVEELYKMERDILLESIDELWIEHLTEIERLEEGLDLVGYAEMDPLVIFRKEVGMMYQELVRRIRRRAVKLWFAITIDTETERTRRKNWGGGRRKRKG